MDEVIASYSLNDPNVSRGLHKLSSTRNEDLIFKFPVNRSKTGVKLPVTPKARVIQQLVKCAGQLAYDELINKKGFEVAPVVEEPDSPLSPQKKGLDASPTSPKSPSKIKEEEAKKKRKITPVKVQNKKDQLKPGALIEFANSQIDQLVTLESRKGNITDLERARMVVKFMSQKNKPLKNREFYQYFYTQQEKSEKIESYENVKNIVQDVLRQVRTSHEVDGLNSSQGSEHHSSVLTTHKQETNGSMLSRHSTLSPNNRYQNQKDIFIVPIRQQSSSLSRHSVTSDYMRRIAEMDNSEIQDKNFSVRQKKAILSKIRMDQIIKKQAKKIDTSDLEGAALQRYLEKQKTVVNQDIEDVSDVINRMHIKNSEYKENHEKLDKYLRKLKNKLTQGHEDTLKQKQKVKEVTDRLVETSYMHQFEHQVNSKIIGKESIYEENTPLFNSVSFFNTGKKKTKNNNIMLIESARNVEDFEPGAKQKVLFNMPLQEKKKSPRAKSSTLDLMITMKHRKKCQKWSPRLDTASIQSPTTNSPYLSSRGDRKNTVKVDMKKPFMLQSPPKRLMSIESVDEGKDTHITFKPAPQATQFAEMVQCQIEQEDETFRMEAKKYKNHKCPPQRVCQCAKYIRPQLEKEMVVKRKIFSQHQQKRRFQQSLLINSQKVSLKPSIQNSTTDVFFQTTQDARVITSMNDSFEEELQCFENVTLPSGKEQPKSPSIDQDDNLQKILWGLQPQSGEGTQQNSIKALNDSIFSSRKRAQVMTPKNDSTYDYSKLAPSELGKIGSKVMPLSPMSHKSSRMRNTQLTFFEKVTSKKQVSKNREQMQNLQNLIHETTNIINSNDNYLYTQIEHQKDLMDTTIVQPSAYTQKRQKLQNEKVQKFKKDLDQKYLYLLENSKTKAETHENHREVIRKIFLDKKVDKVLTDLKDTMNVFNRVKSQVRPSMSQVSSARKQQLQLRKMRNNPRLTLQPR